MATVSINTIGKLLRSEREAQQLTVEAVSAETKIRPQYIQALEQDNYQVFSSPTHAKGFLLSYARLLGIDQGRVLSMYRRDVAEQETGRKNANHEQVSVLGLPSFKNKRLWLAGLATAAIIASFALFQISIALTPPKLELSSPETLIGPGEATVLTDSDTIVLSGKVNSSATLRINNGLTPLQPTGEFTTAPIPVGSTRTTFVLTATSPLRQETQIILHVTRSSSSP